MSLPQIELTGQQRALVARPLASQLWLEGPAGCGKTTAGAARLLRLLESGARPDTVLVLTPQRPLAAPYHAALLSTRAGSQAQVMTLQTLARRVIDLFFPLVAEAAGFAFPDRPPTFLTMETAQYYMARIVAPLLRQGFFDSATVSPNRLYSQVLDNLNKAALVGFPHTEIGARLKAASCGEVSQLRMYDDAQECAIRFRRLCLDQNLLDYSLQLEVFRDHLWRLDYVREYLQRSFHHLIVDNVEEDTPLAHDLLLEWLPAFDSALIIYDQDAGYRRFLGADPESALRLKRAARDCFELTETLVTPPALSGFAQALGAALGQNTAPERPPRGISAPPAVAYTLDRFHPQMLDRVADRVLDLTRREGVPPGEIAILSPFLNDALRFSLSNRLEQRGIATFSRRPSRSLRDEPATHCLLTFAALAYPEWGLRPSRFDLAFALNQGIAGMDLVRAQILAEIVYKSRDGRVTLGSFDVIRPEMQARITHVLGARYERLRAWLDDYRQNPLPEPDFFFSRLFGELLSQPGFGFHAEHDAGKQAARLIESACKFRWAAADSAPGKPLGQEYLEMVRDGVLAAQYLDDRAPADAVLLAPASTFLIANRAVDVQIWLDIGSSGWWERLEQPLTHPSVLSRNWPPDAVWTDAHEFSENQKALYRLALGLTRRCRGRIILAISELNEQGFDQQGVLLAAIDRLAAHFEWLVARPEESEAHV